MRYTVELTSVAVKQIKSLDKATRLMILKWMDKHLNNCENPFSCGHGLTGELTGFWRYRVGSYRIIAKIEKNELKILVIEVGHRSDIYR